MAFCSKCGTELTEGAKFCPKCGNPIGNTQVESSSYEDSSNTGQFDQNDSSDNAEESMFNYKYICIIVLCLIAFAFLFLWALAHDSDNGGGLYTYISLISILGVLVLALLIYLEQLTKSTAIKTTIGIVVYFALMAINVPIASEELRNERKARNEQKIIEQKQESAAEKRADREANEKQEKIKRVAEIAYKMGYDTRKATWGETIASEDAAAADYRYRYAVDPEDAGQSERWNVFRENYQKGFSDAADEIINKFRKEDF